MISPNVKAIRIVKATGDREAIDAKEAIRKLARSVGCGTKVIADYVEEQLEGMGCASYRTPADVYEFNLEGWEREDD